MNLVSVVVPIYQTRAFLRRALTSALEQTHRELEVVLVDDGSTDGAVEEIRDLVDGRRVRLLAQPNRGVAAARNAGWRASRGEHLLFLDSDDEIAPGLVERLSSALGEGGPRQVAYCDVSRIDVHGKVLPGQLRTVAPARRHLDGNLLPALVFGGFFQIHCMLMPRALLEAAGGFDPRFPWCEDFHLHLRLFALGGRARFLEEPLARYRIRPESKSRDRERMRKWTAAAIDDAARRYPTAFAAALPDCHEEFEWLREEVRRDGEEHLRRCCAHVTALEADLRRDRGAPALAPDAKSGWRARVLAPLVRTAGRRWELPPPASADAAEPPPAAVAALFTRLLEEAAAETEAIWSEARRRLERCGARARRLERALARRGTSESAAGPEPG